MTFILDYHRHDMSV